MNEFCNFVISNSAACSHKKADNCHSDCLSRNVFTQMSQHKTFVRLCKTLLQKFYMLRSSEKIPTSVVFICHSQPHSLSPVCLHMWNAME